MSTGSSISKQTELSSLVLPFPTTLLNKTANESNTHLIKRFYLYCLAAANVHVDQCRVMTQGTSFFLSFLSFGQKFTRIFFDFFKLITPVALF